jgi:small GTP-binding protein
MKTIEKVAKICLFGEASVGKTSLIRRYVLDIFDDKYLATIGAKVSKKKVTVPVKEEENVDLTMMIWDIMGQKGFRKLLEEAYFAGASAAVGVCDITRRETLADLEEWIREIYGVTGKIPIIILANKVDLKGPNTLTEDDVRSIAIKYNAPYLFTSAKTGENVDNAFQKLSELIVKK